MTVEPEEAREALFQATITAGPEVLARCDGLDLDILPSSTYLPDGRASTRAILRLDQLAYLVGAGATVVLERLIDPRLPAERIVPSGQAGDRLQTLRQARRQQGG